MRESVSSVLHGILFTRLLHNQHPVSTHTTTITGSTTSYAYCKLQDADVEKQIDVICQQLISNDSVEKTVIVSIMKKDNKRQHGWSVLRPRASTQETEVLERWTVNVKIVPQRSQPPDLLAKAVQESLIYIASSAMSTPPKDKEDSEEISFRLEILGGSESLASMFKRMLSDSNIPPLLG